MASFLESIRRWFENLFGIAKTEKVEILQETTPEISVAKTPGLSCPVCSHRIIVSIENLLSGQDIQCPSCGLELTVDKDKSDGALDALNKLQSGLNQASKIKSENGI
jgi:DNA-directed RNA polymerase subunit RPC12/RpoP